MPKMSMTSPTVVLLMRHPEPNWLAKQRVILFGGWQIWIIIKRNMTSVFVNKYLAYIRAQKIIVRSMICLLRKCLSMCLQDTVSSFMPTDTESEGINNCFGAQAFNKRTLDALKFDQRKDQTKKQHSKRQFLSQHTKINSISRPLPYRWICNQSCCFACELRHLNSCSKALRRLKCLPFNMSIHRIENKRADNRNLFSHNWKNFGISLNNAPNSSALTRWISTWPQTKRARVTFKGATATSGISVQFTHSNARNSIIIILNNIILCLME